MLLFLHGHGQARFLLMTFTGQELPYTHPKSMKMQESQKFSLLCGRYCSSKVFPADTIRLHNHEMRHFLQSSTLDARQAGGYFHIQDQLSGAASGSPSHLQTHQLEPPPLIGAQAIDVVHGVRAGDVCDLNVAAVVTPSACAVAHLSRDVTLLSNCLHVCQHW